MKKILVLLFLACIFQACTKELKLATQKDVKWQLSEWPGKTIPSAAKATLNFMEGNRISGKSFCNNYGGTAVINGNAIQFGKMFSTKMLCQSIGDTENKYQADLAKVTSGKFAGNKLSLYAGEKVILVFTRVK